MKTSPDSGMIHTGFRTALSDSDWRVLLEKPTPSAPSLPLSDPNFE
jgi:hypothetical protein